MMLKRAVLYIKIKELWNAKMSEKLQIRVISNHEPHVGIWWWTEDGRIIGFRKPKSKGANIDGVIHYSSKDNHNTLWKKALFANLLENEVAVWNEKGVESLHRGEVYYDARTMCYEITCCSKIINNEDFRKKVVSVYKLEGARYEFVSINI